MALETMVLDPPHYYVPWITLNGTHTEEIQSKATTNLLKLVCDTYPLHKPKECENVGNLMEVSGRCYRW